MTHSVGGIGRTAVRVQQERQDDGQRGHGDGPAGAEDRELLVDLDPDAGGDRPAAAQRPPARPARRAAIRPTTGASTAAWGTDREAADRARRAARRAVGAVADERRPRQQADGQAGGGGGRPASGEGRCRPRPQAWTAPRTAPVSRPPSTAARRVDGPDEQVGEQAAERESGEGEHPPGGPARCAGRGGAGRVGRARSLRAVAAGSGRPRRRRAGPRSRRRARCPGGRRGGRGPGRRGGRRPGRGGRWRSRRAAGPGWSGPARGPDEQACGSAQMRAAGRAAVGPVGLGASAAAAPGASTRRSRRVVSSGMARPRDRR